MTRVFVSKYSPGAKGSDIGWNIGDKALYTNSKGEQTIVIIDSELMSHEQAPGNGLIYECIFTDDNQRWAAYADALTPILSDEEKGQMKEIGL